MAGLNYQMRQWALVGVVAPKLKHVLALNPDDVCLLDSISRQESIDRGLSVYIGKPCPLSKVFRLKDGGFGSIRYVSNGLTDGMLRLQRMKTKGDNHE